MPHEKTFLIVDDDTDDLHFFCEVVNDIDPSIKCFTAFDGVDALRQLGSVMKKLPDYIFLDLNMPRMDGREFLAEIKKDKKLKNVPVIIFSTSALQRDMEDTKKLGAVHYLIKPTDLQKLKQQIILVMKTVDAAQ